MSDPLRLRYPPPHEGVEPSPTAEAARSAPSPSELDRARALLRQQQIRSAAFAPVRTLFQDPAWDILLGLFIAYEEGAPLSIDAVRTATGLSEVAIRRWMLALEHCGLVTCWPNDATLGQHSIGRHSIGHHSIGLTDQAVTMMLQFLQEI